MPTMNEIMDSRTPRGGWSKAQMAKWGVPWPPPKGWQQKLIDGEEFETNQFDPSPIDSAISAHELLIKVVTAVVGAGHASDLYEFPDVLEYFGARNPEPHEIADHHPRSTAAR